MARWTGIEYVREEFARLGAEEGRQRPDDSEGSSHDGVGSLRRPKRTAPWAQSYTDPGSSPLDTHFFAAVYRGDVETALRELKTPTLHEPDLSVAERLSGWSADQKRAWALHRAVIDQRWIMLQALWTAQAALAAADLDEGVPLWLRVLQCAPSECIRWTAQAMERSEMKPALMGVGPRGLTPLMAAVCNAPESFGAALPLIDAQDFWRLDAYGASALDHALGPRLNFRPWGASISTALMRAAETQDKKTPKARQGWKDWLRLALGASLNGDHGLDVFWAEKQAQCERAALQAVLEGAQSEKHSVATPDRADSEETFAPQGAQGAAPGSLGSAGEFACSKAPHPTGRRSIRL